MPKEHTYQACLPLCSPLANSLGARRGNNFGFSCNILHKYGLAIADFGHAIKLNPNCATAFVNRGKA